MTPPIQYIFELPLAVRDYEVDYQGIVNNANYLHYMEHTRHEWCREAGLTFEEMHRQGIDPVVRRLDLEYLHPLRMGQPFTSRLWLERRGPLYIFHQDLYDTGERLCVRGLISIACVVRGRLTRGDELMEAFGRYLSQQPCEQP